jgi:hypothetical protein
MGFTFNHPSASPLFRKVHGTIGAITHEGHNDLVILDERHVHREQRHSGGEVARSADRVD